jgi:AraC family transcriptional regulator of adaptative response / DNA-3-methyladenine glycosylase II
VQRLPGLRVPGSWDGFEIAVRAVLGQQVTVRGATTLAGRLARTYGRPLEAPALGRAAGLDLLFPEPEVLSRADLTAIGLTSARSRAIRGLSRAVADGDLVLDGSADPVATLARLYALPGLGPWTAQYVALRALGEPDAFPAGDLGLRKAVANGAAELPSAGQLERQAESWRPWRAYAAMYLWCTPRRRRTSP